MSKTNKFAPRRIEQGDVDLITETLGSVTLVAERMQTMVGRDVTADDVNFVNGELHEIPDDVLLSRLTVLDCYHGVPTVVVKLHDGMKLYLPNYDGGDQWNGRQEIPILGWDRGFVLAVHQVNLKYGDWSVKVTKETGDGECDQKTFYNSEGTVIATVTTRK